MATRGWDVAPNPHRAVRAGLRVEELPIVFHERRAAHSKLSAGVAAEAL